MEGTVIGTYRVLRKLGEGGMGAVYLAEHQLLGRKAAVKVLQPELSKNQDIVQRFFNEARAATAIADPGIVQIFDFGYHHDGSAYIVMEFLEGESLGGRLERLGRLAPADALRILRQVASSLGAAHARGIVHRDLKPDNIFLVHDREVAYGERPKLLDFGIAKLTGDTESKIKTNTSAIMGTPVYMSPEQCRGAGYVDHRSDLYSLGCVLFHMLVGRPPFDGEGVGDIIACHLREPAPAPSAAVPGIGPDVDALCLRLMAKQPEQRFASASELADAIGMMLGTSLPPGTPMPMGGGYSTGDARPTTLSGSAGHLHVQPAPSLPGSLRPKRKRAGLMAGVIAGVAIATAVVIVAVAAGGGDGGVAKAGAPGPGAVTGTATGSGSGSASVTGAGSGSATGSVTGVGSGSESVTGTATGPGSGSATGPGSGSATVTATGAGPDAPPATAAAGVEVPPIAGAVAGPAPTTTTAPVTTTARTTTATGSRASTRTGRRTTRTTTPDAPPTAQPPGPTGPRCATNVPGDYDCDGIPDDR